MCEFKKGDKVICISTDNHPELIKDKIYEVEKPNGDFVYLKGCKYGYFTFLFRKECEYCKGDIWERKTIESDLHNEYIVGDKALLIANWTPAFDGYNAECNWEAELPINYCPMCGRKLGEEK